MCEDAHTHPCGRQEQGGLVHRRPWSAGMKQTLMGQHKPGTNTNDLFWQDCRSLSNSAILTSQHVHCVGPAAGLHASVCSLRSMPQRLIFNHSTRGCTSHNRMDMYRALASCSLARAWGKLTARWPHAWDSVSIKQLLPALKAFPRFHKVLLPSTSISIWPLLSNLHGSWVMCGTVSPISASAWLSRLRP